MLGVEPGASPDDIKAAWRGLARRHHPDLTGDDPEAARRATRRMAEINAAYAALTRAGETIEAPAPGRRTAADAAATATGGAAAAPATGRRPARRPAARRRPPARSPARLDLSGTVPPRNQTTTPPGARMPLTGQPPLRHDRSDAGAARLAAVRARSSATCARATCRPEPPTLDEALELEVDFGKFHGHTLGEVAAFEPSYIDWLAGTVTRDPALAMAARVICAELDRRGIRRAHRPPRPGWQSNPFR